jgi:hypothetical protein
MLHLLPEVLQLRDPLRKAKNYYTCCCRSPGFALDAAILARQFARRTMRLPRDLHALKVGAIPFREVSALLIGGIYELAECCLRRF